MKNRKETRQNICGTGVIISIFLFIGTFGGIETGRIDILPGIGMTFLLIGALAFFAWLGGAWQLKAPKKGARK